MFVRLARRSAASLSGGRSIGPACASASARMATVPPLTTNVSVEPPSRTSTNAAPNAVSATGLAPSATSTAPMISRTSPASTSRRSAPSRSTTRKIPPTTGTASSSFKVPSATNWTAMSGQFAAASKAPRLSEDFNAGGCGIDRSIVPLAVFCWFSVLSCFRAVSRSNGDVAPPARSRAHRGGAGDTCGRGVRGLALRRVLGRRVGSPRATRSAATSIGSQPCCTRVADGVAADPAAARALAAGPDARARPVRPRRSPHRGRRGRHRRCRGD